MGLVPRRPHSPPFKGGVAAQRPGWLVKRREATFFELDESIGRPFSRRTGEGVPYPNLARALLLNSQRLAASISGIDPAATAAIWYPCRVNVWSKPGIFKMISRSSIGIADAWPNSMNTENSKAAVAKVIDATVNRYSKRISCKHMTHGTTKLRRSIEYTETNFPRMIATGGTGSPSIMGSVR